jgi:hypothetical protein
MVDQPKIYHGIAVKSIPLDSNSNERCQWGVKLEKNMF